jgi:hypothetical protein
VNIVLARSTLSVLTIRCFIGSRIYKHPDRGEGAGLEIASVADKTPTKKENFVNKNLAYYFLKFIYNQFS